MADQKLTEDEVKEELSPEELAVAKDMGLIDGGEEEEEKIEEEVQEEEKEDEDSELEDEGTEEEVEEDEEEEKEEEPEEVEEEEKIEVSSDLDETFEEMENNPAKEHEELSKFNKSQKAFYWKWKNTNKKKQEAVAKAELQEVRIKALEQKLEGMGSNKRDEIDDLIDQAEANTPLTKAEFAAEQQRAAQQQAKAIEVKKRIFESGQVASSKYDDFQKVAGLANELMNNDTSGQYYSLFFNEAEKPDGDPAEFIYKLGKQHPKYSKATTKQPTKKAAKVIKSKKQTSASLNQATDGEKKKKFDPDNITLEEAGELSEKAWRDLPKRTRDKLLKM